MYQLNISWTDNFGRYVQASIVCDMVRIFQPIIGSQHITFTTNENCMERLREFSRSHNSNRNITIFRVPEEGEKVMPVTIEDCSIPHIECECRLVMGDNMIPETSIMYHIHSLSDRVVNHHEGNLIPMFADGVTMCRHEPNDVNENFKTIITSIVKDL